MKTTPQLELPQFMSEAEEAQWWYDHRKDVAEDFVKAIREGRTSPGSVARLKARLAAQQTDDEEEGSASSSPAAQSSC